MAANKKNAARLDAHIVFIDESGFLLIPTVVRTWAPVGQTPVHRHRQGRHDRVSVISGISVSPHQRLGLYYLLFFDNIAQQEVCLFIRELMRHCRGHLFVVLDNSPTHKGRAVQQLAQRFPRLHLEHLPAYAPELNPDEGVWALAKRAIANTCPHNRQELLDDIMTSLNAIKRSKRKLRGCIQQSDLPPFLH
jgi:transposase